MDLLLTIIYIVIRTAQLHCTSGGKVNVKDNICLE